MPSLIKPDRHIQGLVSAAVDGELSATEAAELDALRREHPEIAVEVDEMRAVGARIAAIAQEDPPPDLYDRIVSNLPPRPQVAATGTTIARLLARLKDLFGGIAARRPALAMAYAFALGLLIAIPTATVLSPALSPGNSTAASIGVSPVIESLESTLRLGDENVTITVTRSKSSIGVHIPRFGRRDGVIELSFPAGSLAIQSIEVDDEDGSFDMSSSPGSVRIMAPSPAGVGLTLRPIANQTRQSLEVRLSSRSTSAVTKFDLGQ